MKKCKVIAKGGLVYGDSDGVRHEYKCGDVFQADDAHAVILASRGDVSIVEPAVAEPAKAEAPKGFKK